MKNDGENKCNPLENEITWGYRFQLLNNTHKLVLVAMEWTGGIRIVCIVAAAVVLVAGPRGRECIDSESGTSRENSNAEHFWLSKNRA